MSYLVAITIGLVCLGLINIWAFGRSPQVSSLEQVDRTPSTLIADAPPPEDKGTPGSRT